MAVAPTLRKATCRQAPDTNQSGDPMPAWGDSRIWRVLDTDFHDGSRFLAHWASWLGDGRAPRELHYVAIAASLPDADALAYRMRAHGPLASQVAGLQRLWPGRTTGFHRFELSAGRVLLTLCVGSLPQMLREQQFLADNVVLHGSPVASAVWDRWTIKSLARLCRRGTGLQVLQASPTLLDALTQAGMAPDPGAADDGHHLRFNPRWEASNTRHRWRHAAPAPNQCAIVGAGLAGATAAAALARRGWQVTVLDASPLPAAGASGLPAALMVPQPSRDDNSRSRLSRAGVQLTRQWCAALLREQEDWAPSGVRQLFPDQPQAEPVWHASGAWIKPARLVYACLARPGVRFIGGAVVHRAVRHPDSWTLLDAAGRELVRAPQLVLAAANGTAPLLERLHCADGAALPALQMPGAMQTVGGQISWGMQSDDDAAHFPDAPVNGRGHFLAHVPMDGQRAWFLGASYETAAAPRLSEAISHSGNWQRLAHLSPAAARVLAGRFEAGAVRAWHGIRCTTSDRLPAVGPLQLVASPCLWISAGMGSRGLTYAVLCAELLAGQLGGLPLPVEASLARLLAAGRHSLSDHL